MAELLDSLAEQNFPEPFEIIVVDNDAAGGAATTVGDAKMRHPELDIRYSVELQKGISFARNTAVSLAVGKFLAWIDDDETATENWLEFVMDDAINEWRGRCFWSGRAGFSSRVLILAES